jgi:hypothetical protein
MPVVPTPPVQALPVARHWPATQHPPAVQLLAGQHAWPAPPHGCPAGVVALGLLLHAMSVSRTALNAADINEDGSCVPIPFNRESRIQ